MIQEVQDMKYDTVRPSDSLPSERDDSMRDEMRHHSIRDQESEMIFIDDEIND